MEVASKINGTAPMDDQIIERVIAAGDLKLLKADERNSYYLAVCRSLNLNPLTRPLEYITLSGKLVLYARKDCTEQLRRLHGVSITKLETSTVDGVFEAMAYASTKDRQDVDFGAVSIKGLTGDALVNAKLKAITKAKRRVTLSICGLGFLDETEIETIPTVHAAPAQIEAGTPPDDNLITRDQRKRMNDFIGNLKVKFGLTNDVLAAKMNDLTGCERSADLTIDQADEMIGVYATWLNQLEEAAFENAKAEADKKGPVPF
jgi:hypothetical protein